MAPVLREWFETYFGWTRLVALFLVCFALFVRDQDPIPLQVLRNLAFDSFQQISPREASPQPVAIVDIDDRSIAEIGQWPWPRTRFAEIIEKVAADGAAVIGFDIVFSEPDRLSPGEIAADNPDMPPELAARLRALLPNDLALAAAISRARVVLGQTSIRLGVEEYASAAPEVPHGVIGPDPRRFIQNYPDLIENLPEIEAAAAGRAMFNVRPEFDGVYRKIPLVMSVEGQLRLGLAPEVLRVATGSESFLVRSNAAGVEGIVPSRPVGLVPTAGDGTIRPYLTPSRPGRFVSATDILNDRVAEGRFRGHLVLVGTSAIGLQDYRATTLGVQMAGVEIHAQILENMLSGTFLKRPAEAKAIELVGAAVVCLLIIVLTPIMRAGFLIVSTLVFLVTIGLGSYVLFLERLLLYDATFPILAGLATIMFMSAANYLREERQRRQIRTAFGQYVSKDLVSVLADSHTELRLGGETREITLLFSDVQGFTAIAEGYRDDPEGLTSLMNQFLTRLSNAILEERGTIDKFMGDAVMAFWNAPLSRTAHEHEACRAALEMIRQVDDLNATRRAARAELAPIEVGIGINTGLCTVGNMGSDLRFDYTAMGDPVNIASRLEGQTRQYGVRILIGNATAEKVADDFAVVEMDLIRVKGKATPERVFALLGGAEMRARREFGLALEQNAAMLAAYRTGEWDRAEACLDALGPQLRALEPRMETHLAQMRARIAAMRSDGMPRDWDGVFVATAK